jgi:hypothetical protein
MTRLTPTPRHRHTSTLAALLCLSLAACGGGGGSSDSSTSTTTSTDGAGTKTTTTTTNGSTTTTTTDANGNVIPAATGTAKNVALASNGATASATYDTAHATYANDGATSGSAWVGSVSNDALTVAFDKTYHVAGFTLHTNATNNVDTRIELSTDGTTYTTVNLLGAVIAGGSGIPCSGLNMGSGKIECTLSSMPQASRIRVVVTATTAADIANTHLYELEVTGQ